MSMTPQSLYIFKQALKQIGLWVSDEEAKAIAERVIEEARG